MQQLVGHLSAQDRDAKIVSMYKAGALRREISEQVGCGHSTISLVLKRHGVDNRGSRKGCLSPDVGEAVRRLYLSGLSVTEVGKKLGMTRNAVSGVIFRNRISRDGTGAPVARARCAPQKAKRRAAKAEKAKPQLVVVPAEAITVFQAKRAEPERRSKPKLQAEAPDRATVRRVRVAGQRGRGRHAVLLCAGVPRNLLVRRPQPQGPSGLVRQGLPLRPGTLHRRDRSEVRMNARLTLDERAELERLREENVQLRADFLAWKAFRSHGNAEAIAVGPIALWPDQGRVEVNGRSVHLTGRQRSLLECLARRKNATVTKGAILDFLYGGMDEPEAKIVDVLVCQLRAKLRAFGVDRHIETIWGLGYRLSDAVSDRAPNGGERERERAA